MNRRLIDFICAAASYAATPSDAKAARLLDSPYAGVPRSDGRALVLAGADRGVRYAVEHEMVPLSDQSTLAVQRFLRALDTLASLPSTHPCSALAFVQTVARAYNLNTELEPDERTTLAAVEGEAGTLDAQGAWDASLLVKALRRYARTGTRQRHKDTALPLPWYAPESTRPIPRRIPHFSPSSLGMFTDCERRWFYHYVCASVEDKGSSAALYGTAFHWALERFHGAFPRADATPKEHLEQHLSSSINTAFAHFGSRFPTKIESELQRRRAQRTAVQYLTWFFKRSRESPFSVIGIETEAALELEGFRFIGYIDRLDCDDATGAITIVDYKTGSIANSAGEQRAKIANFIDFQLPFYYWVRTASGDHVTRLMLLPLKDASLGVQPIELEVVPIAAPVSGSDASFGRIGINELEQARAKMIEIARKLSEDPIEHFPATENPQACTWCAYQNSCRARPSRLSDRFAR